MREHLIKRFILKVCNYFGTTPELAYQNSKSREQPYILVRYFVYLYLKEYTGKSLSTIGIYFRQPHSTVIHALDALDNWVKTDAKMAMHKKHIEKKALIIKGEVASVRPKVKALPRRFKFDEMYKLVSLCFDAETADWLSEFYEKNKNINL
jgi:hypothetical protein